MGWKNVKHAYRIRHIVHVTEQGVCIGSPYISDIIVIGLDGSILKRYDRDGWATGQNDLARYQSELAADPARLQRLIAEPDHFEKSVPVFTYDGGRIIEKHCEEPGWPNVTHDGELMYDNRFSVDKAKVVEWAKTNADAGISMYARSIAQAREELSKLEQKEAECQADRAQLEADYPTESVA